MVAKAADFQPSRRARQVALAYQDAISGDGRVNLLEAWSIRPGHVEVHDRHGFVIDVENECKTIEDYRSAHRKDLWDEASKKPEVALAAPTGT